MHNRPFTESAIKLTAKKAGSGANSRLPALRRWPAVFIASLKSISLFSLGNYVRRVIQQQLLQLAMIIQ